MAPLLRNTRARGSWPSTAVPRRWTFPSRARRRPSGAQQGRSRLSRARAGRHRQPRGASRRRSTRTDGAEHHQQRRNDGPRQEYPALSNAWAVGRFDLFASQANLPTEIAPKIPPVKWLAAAGHINGGVSARLLAEAKDDQAAENLRGVVNGVMSLARLQAQNDPKLTSLVNSFQMSGQRQDRRLAFALPAEIFELMAPKAQGVCPERPLISGLGAHRFADDGRLILPALFFLSGRPAAQRPAIAPSRFPCTLSAGRG